MGRQTGTGTGRDRDGERCDDEDELDEDYTRWYLSPFRLGAKFRLQSKSFRLQSISAKKNTRMSI